MAEPNFVQRLLKRQKKNEEPTKPPELVPGRPLAAVGAGRLPPTKTSILQYVGRETAQKRDPIGTLRLIRDYSPDASLAVWNFLRMVNPSLQVVAKFLPDQREVDAEGTARLNVCSDGLLGSHGRDYGGGLHQLVNVLTLTLITQGAIAGELELSDDLKDVLDWCPVDPRKISFHQDEKTGHFLPVVNWRGRDYELPEQQFRYIPLDPAIGDPYGRGLLWPTMEAVFFQTEVLRDLKMVAHTAGHPRMHVAILEALAEKHLPAHLRRPGKDEEARSWMNGFLNDIADEYKTLRPDDAFFHWDWAEPEAIDAGRSSYDLKALVQVVEHQVFSALKQLPVLMGRVEGTGLAHGTIQWEIFAQTVTALRQPVATLASWWATQTLRVWGYPSVGRVTFPTIRTRDRLKEAQSQALETKTAVVHYLMGWASNEELAQKHVGHEPVGEPDIPSVLGKPELGTVPFGGEVGEAGEGEEGELSRQGYGVSVGGGTTEAQYFAALPLWMRRRISRLGESVGAMATVRRGKVFSALEYGTEGRDVGVIGDGGDGRGDGAIGYL